MKSDWPFRPFPPFLATLVFATAFASSFALAEGAVSTSKTVTNPSPAIVVGFVGGFVNHENLRHSPVQLAQRIRESSGKDTFVQVFENRHRHSAYKAILRALDSNHDGTLSALEKSNARIVLFGHSWGASAAVLLARELGRDGIPVRLTIQVDSIAKLWQDDGTIPNNVAEAVNYFQPHGLVHGRHTITAADPARTRILGNYLVDYRKNPVECPARSWFDLVTPSHAQSECDPHLWSKIEDLVRQTLGPVAAASAVNVPPASLHPTE